MEKWILVEGFLCNKESLQNEKIPFSHFEIEKPRRVKGVSFPAKNLEDFLRIHSLSLDLFNEVATDTDNMFFLDLKKRKFSVSVGNWSGENKEKFVEITESFANKIEMDVVLSVPHGVIAKPQTDSKKFHIFIWSAPYPGKKEKKKTPVSMWDIIVDCSDLSLCDSDEGEPIIDSRGCIVGELVGNNLYIHHDVCHYGSKNELDIFRFILEATIEEIHPISPEEQKIKEEKRRKRFEEDRIRSRELFVKANSKRLEKTIEKKRKEIYTFEERVDVLQQEIIKLVRRSADAQRSLDQMEIFKPEALKVYEKEFDNLLSIPDVVKIEVVDETIKVFTNMIYIEWEGVVKKIGEFLILINTVTGSIKFLNLTNNGNGPGYILPQGYDASRSYNRHHPHVNKDGEACLGNMTDAIPRYIGEYQYSVVALLAIKFLKSVNTDDDAGKGIKWWPNA